MPTRLKSLRSSSDEYNRILDVLIKYSIHNSGISIVCKKASSSSADINTSIGATVLENIGTHYGEAVRKELVRLEVKDAALGAETEGWFSNANYSARKGTFLFFINRTLRHLSTDHTISCPIFLKADVTRAFPLL